MYDVQQVISNGGILKSLTWINELALIQKDVFSKFIVYHKQLNELHNNYSLAPYEIEIQFFNSPPFPNSSHLDHNWYPKPHRKFLVWLTGNIPHNCSPSASHPTFPRGQEDFSRSGKHTKDVSLPTFVAYFQSVYATILEWYIHA